MLSYHLPHSLFFLTIIPQIVKFCSCHKLLEICFPCLSEHRMCLGTFSRQQRSLATSTLYAAVCIRAERFLLYRKTISCKVKKIPYCPFLLVMTIANLLLKSCYFLIYLTVFYHPAINFLLPLPAMQKYPSDYFLFQFLICS